MNGLSSFNSVVVNFKMVSFKPETVFLCLATVVVSSQVIDATIFAGRNQEVAPEELPVAEDRIFKAKKLGPLLHKKKLLSLLSQSAQPQVVHTLSPIEHYPIWKVHKYKGIELRPVQVVDLPSPFDYSPVQPGYYQPAEQYGPPAAEPARMPHTEYGTPVVDYSSFNSGIVKPEEPTTILTGGGDFHHVQIQAPVTTYQGPHHGGKIKALLGLLTKLRNLKRWKLGLKHGSPLLAHGARYGVPLPEVHEIPVKGLENLNLQVPELPGIGFPSHASAVTGGPYVKVQVASPAPVVSYGTPDYQTQYAPQYAYQYPPYSPQYSLPDQYGPPAQGNPVHTPAPYYGAPPLFNSYGMPLPPDAYSSAPSDQVLSFAVPDNTSQPQQQLQNQFPQEYNPNNNTTLTVEGTVKGEEVPVAKFVTQENEEVGGEDVRDAEGEATPNQHIQTNI